VLGPLSGGSTKPGPLDPDFYYLLHKMIKRRAVEIKFLFKWSIKYLAHGITTEIARTIITSMTRFDKLAIMILPGLFSH
jgi:hypothetical protein